MLYSNQTFDKAIFFESPYRAGHLRFASCSFINCNFAEGVDDCVGFFPKIPSYGSFYGYKVLQEHMIARR